MASLNSGDAILSWSEFLGQELLSQNFCEFLSPNFSRHFRRSTLPTLPLGNPLTCYRAPLLSPNAMTCASCVTRNTLPCATTGSLKCTQSVMVLPLSHNFLPLIAS